MALIFHKRTQFRPYLNKPIQLYYNLCIYNYKKRFLNFSYVGNQITFVAAGRGNHKFPPRSHSKSIVINLILRDRSLFMWGGGWGAEIMGGAGPGPIFQRQGVGQKKISL